MFENTRKTFITTYRILKDKYGKYNVYLENAFNGVNRSILWSSLKSMGINTNLQKAIENIYTQTQLIRLEQIIGPRNLRRGKGLRQLGVLSPTPFNIRMIY